MQNEFKGLIEEAKVADEKYQAAIQPELEKFAKLTK
jgi:hypothetical protein